VTGDIPVVVHEIAAKGSTEGAEAYERGRPSAIAALDPEERLGLLEKVRALAGGGLLTLRYRCDVQVTRREP
jgi:hypothetical protein